MKYALVLFLLGCATASYNMSVNQNKILNCTKEFIDRGVGPKTAYHICKNTFKVGDDK